MTQTHDHDPLEALCRDRRVLLVLSGTAALPTPDPGDVVYAVGSGVSVVTDRRIDIVHFRQRHTARLFPVNGEARAKRQLLVNRRLDDPWPATLQIYVEEQATGHRLISVCTRPQGPGVKPGAGAFALSLLDGVAAKVMVCGKSHPPSYWLRRRDEQGVDDEWLYSWQQQQRATAIDTTYFQP